MTSIILALLMGLKAVTPAPLGDVRLIGSGYDTAQVVMRSNWGINISLGNFQVGAQESKEGILSVDLNLLGGCLSEAYVTNVIHNALLPNSQGYISIRILMDGVELTGLNKRLLEGRQDPYTQVFVEPIRRVCGSTMTLSIYTKLEATGAEGGSKLALINHNFDIYRLGSIYSSAIKENPNLLAAMLVLINILQFL